MLALRNDSSFGLTCYTTGNRCGKTAKKRFGEATAVNISRFIKKFGLGASLQSAFGGIDVQKSIIMNSLMEPLCIHLWYIPPS